MLDTESASWEDVSAAISRGLIAVLPVGARYFATLARQRLAA